MPCMTGAELDAKLSVWNKNVRDLAFNVFGAENVTWEESIFFPFTRLIIYLYYVYKMLNQFYKIIIKLYLNYCTNQGNVSAQLGHISTNAVKTK